MIKKDTGYGANFEKFNEYCQTNRDSLTNLYLTGTLSDWILMEDPNPDGLSSVPSMEYTIISKIRKTHKRLIKKI
jgi:hypothetical protein